MGSRPDSALYVERKEKTCNPIGILSQTLHFHEDAAKKSIIAKINELNQDPQTYGILLQVFSLLISYSD